MYSTTKTKECTRCKEEKILSDFNRGSQYPDGYRFECRICQRSDRVRYIGNTKPCPDSKTLVCSCCGQEKSRDEFNTDNAKANKKRSWCRQCDKEGEWKRHYGISMEDYQSMLYIQGGVCAICKRKPNGENLCVDHNHSTGKVRGLLCKPCNLILGNASDSPEVLDSASEYLRSRCG